MVLKYLPIMNPRNSCSNNGAAEMLLPDTNAESNSGARDFQPLQRLLALLPGPKKVSFILSPEKACRFLCIIEVV